MTPALALDGLKKSFGGLPAMNDVSLEVAPGERRLIIGPNGAGKTTLFNLITGDLRRDAGSIRLFGEEVARLKPHQRAHRGLARTYQIITLFPHDTLQHNVVLSLLGLSRRRWNPVKPLAGWSDVYGEALAVLERVGLRDLAHRPIGEVAYGERRRVEIAMARDRLGRQAPERLAEEPDLAVARRQEADDRAHAGRLAGAVAAEQREHAPRVQREGHVVQHVAVAVERVDAGERERYIRGTL